MFIYYLLNLLFILFKFIKNIFLYMFDLFVFVVLWILSILVLLGWLIALPFVELAALSPRMRERLRSRDYRIRERLSHLYTLREDLWFALFVKPSHKNWDDVRDEKILHFRRIGQEAEFTAADMKPHLPQPEGKYFIRIADGVEKIPESAFAGWNQMQEIILPATLKEIGDHAFAGCTALREIHLPSAVRKIGCGVFEGCSALKKIDLLWPPAVSEIGSGAFKDCTALSEIYLPSSVSKIGSGVFEGCSALREICLPKGVSTIDSAMFKGCRRLENIRLPETVCDIAEDAFRSCPLKRLGLPAALRDRCREFFPSHPVELVCSDEWYLSTWELTSVVRPLKRIGCSAVSSRAITELLLCPGTEIIGDRAFHDLPWLYKVELPPTLRLICRDAFTGCNDLKSIYIPSSVTEIAGDAFPEHTRIIAEPGSYAWRWAEKRGRLAE